MRAGRIAVAIPMGLFAGGVLLLIVYAIYYGLTAGTGRVDDLSLSIIWGIFSIMCGTYLYVVSPSPRETFRRSLPVIGLASLCLDLILIGQLFRGVGYQTVATHAGPVGAALDTLLFTIAFLILLAPILCPVVYFWVVPGEYQAPVRSKTDTTSSPETRKWTLTWLVGAGALATLGLAAAIPCLTFLGIAGVVVFALRLIWY